MYTTTGPIRGGCGHFHRTHDTAERCLAADERGCAQQGGYSDRRIVRVADRAEAQAHRPAQPVGPTT